MGNSKYMQLDNKINDVEIRLYDNIETLDNKYNTLKDQIAKLTRMLEEEKSGKDSNKNKNKEDFKNFEIRIKALVTEEREVFI